MDTLNNIALIVIPFLLILVKDVVPYFIRKYAAKERNGKYNEEILKDINKDIIISFVRFPCDLMVVPAGYMLSKIILFSKQINQLSKDGYSQDLQQNITRLTDMLNFSHVLFWVTLLALLPICMTFTRFCETCIYPRHNEKPRTIRAVLCTVLIYIAVIGFNVKILFFYF